MRPKLEAIEKLANCGRFNHGWSKFDEVYFTSLTSPLLEGFDSIEGPIKEADDYVIKAPFGILRMIRIIIEEMQFDTPEVKEKVETKIEGGEEKMASKYQTFMKKCMKTGKSMGVCAKAWSASPAGKASKAKAKKKK